MPGADSIRVVHPAFFQQEGGGSIPTSALQLQIVQTSLEVVLRLNTLWHSRLPRFHGTSSVSMRFAAIHGGLYYAIAIWGPPSARLLPQNTWLELKRLAIAPDAPCNTASRMISIMARIIHQTHSEIEVLISYQDTEVHTGTIYRASGWYVAAHTKFTPWDHPGRPHMFPDQSHADKVRWQKDLVPQNGKRRLEIEAPALTQSRLY